MRLADFIGIRSVITAVRLHSRVASHLPVLPVLRSQLVETAAQIESAVVQVCTNFQGIADRAREAVSRASAIVGRGSVSVRDDMATVDQLVAGFRVTLEHFLARMQESDEVSARAVARLRDVETASRRIVKALDAVDQIAFQNRLLALNAKIEAVYVGDAGAGFGVVADEIAAQAARSNQLTEQIAEIIAALSGAVEASSTELAALISADQSMLMDNRREAEAALAGIERMHSDMRESLSALAKAGEKLADDIAGAVVGLQFQDRVCQRISHVIEALEAIDNVCGRDHPAENSGRDALARLEGTYTMHDERTVLASASEKSEASGPKGGSVELF